MDDFKGKTSEEMKQEIFSLSVDDSNFNKNEDVGYSYSEPRQEPEVKRFENVDEEVFYSPPMTISRKKSEEMLDNDVLMEGEDIRATGLSPELFNKFKSAVKRGDRVIKKIIPTTQKGWEEFNEEVAENYDGHIGKAICVKYFSDPEIIKTLNSKQIKEINEKIELGEFEGRLIPKYFSDHVRPKRV